MKPAEASITEELLEWTFPKNPETTGDIERTIYHTPGPFYRMVFRGKNFDHPTGSMIDADSSTRETDLLVGVRFGAAAGEPIDHGNDIFGATVQLAARLCAQAVPEQIVVSKSSRSFVSGKASPSSC